MANIQDLSSIATLVLSVSVATERLVSITKTLAPTFLSDEKKTAALETDLVADKGRRVRVLLIAFAAAFLTSALIGDDTHTWLGFIPTHVSMQDGTHISVILLSLLACGGSAFWTNIIGFATAAKDVKTQERTADGLRLRFESESRGISPVDSGRAVTKAKTVPATITQVPPPGTSSREAAALLAGGPV